MAIVYPTPSSVLNQRSNLFQRSAYTLLKPLYLLRALVLRLFWHIKAYSTIMGIMVLALFSIGILWLYETGRKFMQKLSVNPPCAELNASEQK